MVTVSGRLLDFVEDPSNVAQVQVRAREVRPHGDGVMLDHPVTVEWDRGTGVVSFDAAAGTAGVIVWQSVGRSRASGSLPLVVPDKATATLRECVEAVMLADEGTINALERLALEVTGMVATIQNITQLEEWADSAKQDATTATSAATTAQEIATNLPDTIQSELDTRVPPLVPPLVADAIADDRAVANAAAAAVGQAADAIKWSRGQLPLDVDLNGVTTQGVWHATNTVAASLVNGPFSAAFVLQVLPGAGAQVVQIATEIRGASIEADTKFRMSIDGATWSEWKRFLSAKDLAGLATETYVSTAVTGARWNRTVLARDTDLNAHSEPGIFWASAATAATVTNMPAAVAGQAFTLHSIPGVGAYRTQMLHTYRGTTVELDVYYRWTLNNVDWSPWKRFLTDKDMAELTPEPVEIGDGTEVTTHKRDVLKHRSRLRRGGVIGTGGATPVALTFDHGYVNFRDKVLPHLKRLGLPCTSATQPSQMGTGENEGITWADLQNWGLNHGVEYAHHAWSHSDVAGATTNIPALESALLDSIATHKTEMPELVSDSFIMPGVSGTKWDGFNGGNDTESWFDHPAGRILTDNFPVISGTTSGYAVPMVGGEDQSWTMYRWSWDTNTRADEFMQHVQSLQGTGMGIATFMHPSVLDTTDRTTEAKLVEVLEWLAAERDAGRVEVLTLSGFAYADTTSHRRLDLAPDTQWVGDTCTITLDPMLTWAQGAQAVVETTAATTGVLTIAATSDQGGLAASITHDVTAGGRYRMAISIPATARTITLTAPGTRRSCRII